jgi:proteasome assembly chaperone (PAC2) family protein
LIGKKQGRQDKPIRLSARPKLNNPTLLAAWPGVGNVAMIVAQHLLAHLPFKDLGRIEASLFFDPIGVIVRGDIVEQPQFPESRFYYWKNPDGERDIILFIGDDQPSSGSYEMANAVVELAERFQVSRIITFAAALTRIHHTESPRVWGVATTAVLKRELARYQILRQGNLQIAGLNGLLLGVAKERGVPGICLLGEVPNYTTRIQNPMAALAITQTLGNYLKITVNVTDLTEQALEMRERVKEVAARAMEEYIDYFTTPIWESDSAENDDDEDIDENDQN